MARNSTIFIRNANFVLFLSLKMKQLDSKSSVTFQCRFLPEEYGRGLNCSMGNYNVQWASVCLCCLDTVRINTVQASLQQ